ncbi:phytase [Pseudomaricurvus sp. HS19]|uniref:phytase n=1 Tax=Pseudomaricurvus sp. HS19 TaxID=2692626 RepID=UPI0013718A73|nr:phytase [Pseudomaricurvus sp. HS19]MYM63115.1 phytase [Pseudomaricurvus sp. HS19]
MKFPIFTALAAALLLGGCQAEGPSPTAGRWQPLILSGSESAQLLDFADLTDQLQVWATADAGLQLRSADGALLAERKGYYESLDVRPLGDGWLLAAIDPVAQRVDLLQLESGAAPGFKASLTLPDADHSVEGVCLYQDDDDNSFVFVVSEDGFGEQWLVGRAGQLLSRPLSLRRLPLPPQAGFCAVDDQRGELYVNEESVGLWVYPAAAESDTSREPVALAAPYGSLGDEVGNMAVVPGGVVLVDVAAGKLHLLRKEDGDWSVVTSLLLEGLDDPEQLVVRMQPDNQLQLALRDDDSGAWYRHQVAWQDSAERGATSLPYVAALVQTEPVSGHGDAADDPAIWVDYKAPHRSLILGTNKKEGLQVYNLEGELLQSLAIGRLNNVDVRQGVQMQGESLDLAVASHRDHNSLSLFVIDPLTSRVRHAADLPTELAEIYGICLYQPAADQLYAFANSKEGEVIQYRLQADAEGFHSEAVRRWKMDTQPEGCVADDEGHRLFIAEEDTGIWVLGADADAATELEPVMAVGETLKADVEGIALYTRGAGQSPLLVASSQGNDSYVVMDSVAPYSLLANFRIGINGDAGIDGASETDGLEVTSANLGGGWSTGLLVVQDGRNRLPQATQNFKLIPWSGIEALLQEERP